MPENGKLKFKTKGYFDQILITQGQMNKDEDEEQQIDPHKNQGQGLLKRLQSVKMNQKVKKLSTQLKKYLGRHYPIAYKQQFGFTEYWQDKKKGNQKQNQLQYYQYPNKSYFLVAVLILIVIMLLSWCISIHKLFGITQQIQNAVMIVGFLIVIIDGLMQYRYLSYYHYFNDFDFRKYLKIFWRHLLLLAYFISVPLHYSQYQIILIVLDFSIIFLMKNRSDQIRECVKLQIASTTYKNAVNMIQLFGTLLPVAHFFALMLYIVAQSHTQHNWMTENGLDVLQPIEKYVYSLYFTFTTMLTVGYGDISPVNITQILMIICVQIIGIVTYGYIVNEIGHILSKMRLEEEVLSNDISTITKMAKYYDLDKGLVQKAKNFLVCRKKQNAYLTPQEEQKTLIKLQDDLRQQIIRQNSLRILKSSLFYVCNWTKHFHIKIAKMVQKKIFTPNQEIVQIQGKERIYIFKKGKVEIHANRPSTSGYKRHFKKVLRTIEPNESMEVSDNVYGYSFIMSNTPIKLTAFNKEFVVAYYVEGKDFLEASMDGPLDREYFHQMKTKIDCVSCPESWQAPSIINTKQHYFPSIQFLIKKIKNEGRRQKNMRTTKVEIRRFRNRLKRLHIHRMEDMEEVGIQFVGRVIEQEQIHHVHFSNSIEHIRTRKQFQSSKSFDPVDSGSCVKSFIENYASSFNKESLHYMFETGKQYRIYFKRSNRSEIIKKLQTTTLVDEDTQKFKRRNGITQLLYKRGINC